MPANFTTLAHFSVSTAMSLPNSSGQSLPDLGIGEARVDLAIV